MSCVTLLENNLIRFGVILLPLRQLTGEEIVPTTANRQGEACADIPTIGALGAVSKF